MSKLGGGEVTSVAEYGANYLWIDFPLLVIGFAPPQLLVLLRVQNAYFSLSWCFLHSDNSITKELSSNKSRAFPITVLYILPFSYCLYCHFCLFPCPCMPTPPSIFYVTCSFLNVLAQVKLNKKHLERTVTMATKTKSRPPGLSIANNDPAVHAPALFSLNEIAQHHSPSDLWMIVFNKVYNVTDFAQDHPGGVEVLYDCGGVDATEAFEDVAHSNDAVNMLAPYYLGDVHPSEEKHYDKVRIPQDMIKTTSEEPVQNFNILKKKQKKIQRILEKLAFYSLVVFVLVLALLCIGIQKIKWSYHILSAL